MDSIFISTAIINAGKGKPAPNPKVGAVIVKNGRIVGSGYHRRPGLPHAEVIAINEAGKKTQGATLYTNLEPCCHYGKTPPCTDQIIKAGIKRVVIGMVDPDPKVLSRGIKKLREAGIEVTVGIEEGRCMELNRGYIKRTTTGLPYTTIKIASSLDGKIATENGESRWITSAQARTYTHILRSKSDAVLIGIGTLLKDNSQLTVRHVLGENPARIVIDPKLNIPLSSKILSKDAPTFLFSKIERNIDNAKIVKLQDFKPFSILKKIGELGFNEVLIEGGGSIFSSILETKLFDEIVIVFAPKIIGQGVTFAQFQINKLVDSLEIEITESKMLGPDIMIRGINVHRNYYRNWEN